LQDSGDSKDSSTSKQFLEENHSESTVEAEAGSDEAEAAQQHKQAIDEQLIEGGDKLMDQFIDDAHPCNAASFIGAADLYGRSEYNVFL
jgi:hypothetical protein